MSFANVRSVIELKVWEAYQNLSPPVEVIFDNTFESPPAYPYVVCLISFSNTTEAVMCQGESMIENLRGNLQLSIYGERGVGMKKLEAWAAEGMAAMNTMYDWTASSKVKCGPISGPESLLSGDAPYALTTISCPFSASVS